RLRAAVTLVVKEVLYPLELRRIRADVVHVVDQSHAHLVRAVAAPTVVTCHDLFGLGSGGALRRLGYRRRVGALREAGRVIAVSASTRRAALDLGVRPERIALVRNRIDGFFLDEPRESEV